MKLQRILNALLALVLMGVLAAAYYQQYYKRELPCPLCLLQRLGMISIATGALMNLRFGIRIKHYAICLFGAFAGGSISVRQILLHICPGSPIFGIPVFGIGLYIWSFIAFLCAALAVIFLLFLYTNKGSTPPSLSWLDKLAFVVVIILTLMNTITTYKECSFGACPDIPWPQPAISEVAPPPSF